MTTKSDLIKTLYNFSPDEDVLLKLDNWAKIFVEYNSHTNLMSKNDVEVLFEKHAIDSLAIILFDKFKTAKTILDVGTGGGFPSVILSIFFPEIKVYGVDSRIKKINFLNLVKNELKLDNLYPICARVEDVEPLSVDIITNRAVGKIADVWNYSRKHLKKNGYFISYKAKTAEEEADFAMKKFRELKNPEFISYNLPLDENFTRKLVVFRYFAV